MNSTKVYVGDLGANGSKQEIEREFEHYGALKSVWVARNPPGFAFVEFEDPRDADEAVRDMDGKMVCGVRIRVEFAKNNRQSGYSGGRGSGGGPRRGPPPSVVSSRYRRSPRRRSRSPYGRRSRSRSPYYKEHRQRSRSPYRRSPSPRRRHSPSPRRSPDARDGDRRMDNSRSPSPH